MTDPRPICPIPPDAKVGDVVVLRDGQHRKIEQPFDGRHWPLVGTGPGFVRSDGSAFAGQKNWEIVAFLYADDRKPNLPNTKKPKRTQGQRDAAYIRGHMDKWWERSMTQREYDRMLAIADRLEKQQ